MRKMHGKRFWSVAIAVAFLLNSVPYPAYGMRRLVQPSVLDRNVEVDGKRGIEIPKWIEEYTGLRKSTQFKIGYEPTEIIPDNIATLATGLTAVTLTRMGLRGAALGLDKKIPAEKKQISEIKDEADGAAKRIYEQAVEAEDVVMRVRVSEGFGRDEVAESFKSNEVVNPKGRKGVEDAIMDVIEGTNVFVTNVGGKSLEELKDSESGATSVIVTGAGVESLGNSPDYYVDSITTTVPKEKKQEFIDNPLDPDQTASFPKIIIRGYLTRIAKANNIGIGDLEVVLLDRGRESERLAALTELKKKNPGLEITVIKDGTVAHGLLATFGRKQGKHKVVMTTGGAPEAFLNLAVAGLFKDEGALTSMRICTKSYLHEDSKKTPDGKGATSLKNRYGFTKEEKKSIRELRPDDAEAILSGKKLFTQEDVKGDVEGSFSFITHNGVFRVKGAEELPDGSFKVTVLRVGKINGKPCAWFEDKVFAGEKLMLASKGEILTAADVRHNLAEVQEAITYLIEARDIAYLEAVNAAGTAEIVPLGEYEFTPGHDMFQALKKNNAALIAVNIVSANQIKGHLRAAMELNAAFMPEVARSQLGYALDENQAVAYIREAVKNTGAKIPIVIHADHIQYTEKLFDQKAILKEEYEKVHGKGTFNKDIDIDEIDISILKSVKKKLRENAESERKAITDVNERLIRAGFTSIAIDASTIFDEVAADAVLDYYSNYGTPEQKIVVRLEKEFALPLEWGVEFLKLDPETHGTKAILNIITLKIASDMTRRERPKEEIATKMKEIEDAFGVLSKEARNANFDVAKVIDAYDEIMEDVAQVSIGPWMGEKGERIYQSMSENKRCLLLPTCNAMETAEQLVQIEELLKKYKPELIDHFGIEVEVGHVDRKAPNPRRGGKMEAKMTHPMAVRVMGAHLESQGLSTDTIATNNGSGHGTEFDLETLTPVSQVGKISPYLTKELQGEAEKFGASIAQHGTSGSDMDELAEIFRAGVIKFNVATNYQQIMLNVLSLVDDGLRGVVLSERIEADKEALVSGLHEDAREKMKQIAKEIKSDPSKAEIKEDDSLFREFLKRTYAWGVKKGKIKDSSGEKDIAKVLAKEFKRAFGAMDKKLYPLVAAAQIQRADTQLQRAIEFVKVENLLINPAFTDLFGSQRSKVEQLVELISLMEGLIIPENIKKLLEENAARFNLDALKIEKLANIIPANTGGMVSIEQAKKIAAQAIGRRRPIIGGNWKMAVHSKEEAIALLKNIAKEIKGAEGVDVVVAPPFLSLGYVAEALRELVVNGEISEGKIKIAAQNMDYVETGARTGQVSAQMLINYGVPYVILGHSEIRRGPKGGLSGETDYDINRKLKLALNPKYALMPIVCAGESLGEREAGKAEQVVEDMLRKSLKGLSKEDALKVVIAYEPVWAIGTGKTATPEQAEEMHKFIREVLSNMFSRNIASLYLANPRQRIYLSDMFGRNIASQIRIQYGGSVKPDNIAELIAMPDIDGALVGGASLKPDSFAKIVLMSAPAARFEPLVAISADKLSFIIQDRAIAFGGKVFYLDGELLLDENDKLQIVGVENVFRKLNDTLLGGLENKSVKIVIPRDNKDMFLALNKLKEKYDFFEIVSRKDAFVEIKASKRENTAAVVSERVFYRKMPWCRYILDNHLIKIPKPDTTKNQMSLVLVGIVSGLDLLADGKIDNVETLLREHYQDKIIAEVEVDKIVEALQQEGIKEFPVVKPMAEGFFDEYQEELRREQEALEKV